MLYLPLVMRSAGGAVLQITVQPEEGDIPASSPRTLRTVAAPADGSLGLAVAYLHGGDTATAGAFRALLRTRGFQPFLLPLDSVAGSDFSGCDLILVGPDTGPWTDAAARATVLDAGLPVGALGAGGLNFLSAAGLLGGLNSGSGNTATVKATLRGRTAYDFPNAIDLAPDDTVQLYTAASSTRWLNLKDPLPNGIEIGQLPGTTQYPLVQLEARFLLWGCDAGPATMTQAGQDLFVNLLGFQGEALQIPLQSRRFAPQPGIEQALLDELAATPLPNLHAFAQVNDPAGQACRDLKNLASHGVTILYHFWGQTHVASVDKSFKPADPLVAACLRWLGRILPADKVAPNALAGNFSPWAVNPDGTVKILVTFFPDVPTGEAQSILAQHTTKYTPRGHQTWATTMAVNQIGPLSHSDRVRWIQEGPMPGFDENDTARQELFVDDVQDATIAGGAITYNGLDGSGIRVAHMEGGALDNTHPDFAGRVFRTRPAGSFGDHATHVAGIIGASGASYAAEPGAAFQWRGMAPGVEIGSYPDSEDNTADFDEAINDDGAEISNHSYSQTCMRYDGVQSNIDSLIRGDADEGGTAIPARPYHKSAGNNGTSSQYCDVDTDGNGTADAEGVRGYFALTGVAKNQTVVGSLNPGTNYQVRETSARGPTYDGRIKPDLMALGRMKSTVVNGFLDRDGDGDDDYSEPYDFMSGTSMATPAVTGIAALALQQYGLSYGTVHPYPSTVKALLINNATDLVHDPADAGFVDYGWDDPDTGDPIIFHQGPDFSTGYGVVHGGRTVDAVRHRAAVEGQLDAAGEVDEYTVQVLSGRQELRFTLAWDDPAGDPALAEDAAHLVDDLDLILIDPHGGLHYPWIVTPPTPSNDFGGTAADPIATADITPAFRGEDHTNNVEMVTVWAADVNPGDWTGTWTVRVSATALPGAPQKYSLVGEWREITLQDIYPLDAGYNLAPDVIIIPVHVRNPKLSSSAAAGGITADNWRVRVGDSAANSWTQATVEAAYGPVGDLAYVVVRPPNTLAAGILYDLEVTLLGAYQVDQRTAEAYQEIDRATRTDALFFLAEARAPVDEMIVMDNSGSMGDDGKLDAAKNAARAFVDRRQSGDMIGLSYFESTADTLYDLTLVSAGEGELTAVKGKINAMTDLGSTALGSGLLEGKDQLDNKGDPDHTWNIVLLSDGMENVPPCWDVGPGNPYCEGKASMQADFVPAEGCPAIHVDTVTVGPEDASWRPLLEDIANKTCGEAWNATVEDGDALTALPGNLAKEPAAGAEPWNAAEENADVATTPAGSSEAQSTPLIFPQTLPNTLADVYISIADGNTHQQRLWEEVGILATGESISRDVELEGGLPEATFSVNWADRLSPISFKLYRPSGAQVSAGDPDARVKADDTHMVYRMAAPARGKWRLQLAELKTSTEFLAVVSANTDVAMILELGLAPGHRVAGAVMPIYLVLVDRKGPITGANVQTRIRRPDGTIDALTMYDNGTNGDATAKDGVYTNRYTIPATGNYQVRARAQGTAHDGDPFLRYRLRQFRVPYRPRVAYILSTDSSTANQYRTLLEGNGLAVSLINLAKMQATDFKPFSLIIIGPETGSGDTWGDAAKVAQIRDSRKPVLGLGEGGYAFFGELKLAIGHPNGVRTSDQQVVAVDPAQVIWSEPYDLTLAAGAPVATVYGGKGSSGVAVNLGQAGPGVERLARKPSSSIHYWLAREASRYLLWGFNLGPSAMTDTGRGLFVNSAWYAFP